MDATLENAPLKTEVFLKDYTAPNFSVKNLSLVFRLFDDVAEVEAMADYSRTNSQSNCALVLDGGPYMVLKGVSIDGKPLTKDQYSLSDAKLLIYEVPSHFNLKITTELKPKENTRLEGLYYSGGNFCTQCEAEGFRHITYFMHRPDVLTTYKVRVEADKIKCPVSLSNGNLQNEGNLSEDRHFSEWYDPHPKPSYLFALVAGDLSARSSKYVTKSGKKVDLNIYVRASDIALSEYALGALERSMKWDEDTFGLEYDLEVYNIVAVSDFNMGAMENKGLNIFNTKYVLASPESATDSDFSHIEGVIGHEYFHNWTGNRVTCRDWFQLSLKEGLTVFRDQEFSSDLGSRSIKRIDDVKILRMSQFAEDASALAHPVRPEKFVEINNFYTSTIYNKGAEVIRMMHTFLGQQGFRDGMDLYFKRHDGQAVTCEDFVCAMEDANNYDLTQFRLWYSQAGTPAVSFSRNRTGADIELKLHQTCDPTPGQASKLPNQMPIVVGWLDSEGNSIFPEIVGEGEWCEHNCVLTLSEQEQTFVFKNVPHGAVLSFLRGFSAPVNVKSDYSDIEQAFLMAHDVDAMARFEAAQTLAATVIINKYNEVTSETLGVFKAAFSGVLETYDRDFALVAELISLPSEIELAQKIQKLDVLKLHEAREGLLQELATENAEKLISIFKRLQENRYLDTQVSKAKRRLRNKILSYLALTKHGEVLLLEHFKNANNMTDQLAALIEICHSDFSYRDDVIQEFYNQWKTNDLVIDKWFAAQALSKRKDTITRVRNLLSHVDFSYKNPNRLRSLIVSFSSLNAANFHSASGHGYDLLTEAVLEVDKLNPQTAAKIVAPFARWKLLSEESILLMKKKIHYILEQNNLSNDVRELCEKSVS